MIAIEDRWSKKLEYKEYKEDNKVIYSK